MNESTRKKITVSLLPLARADASRKTDRLGLSRAGAKWLTENRSAIEAYNAHVARHGCFGDRLRTF